MSNPHVSGKPEILGFSDYNIDRIVEHLRAGGVAAIPTETVYGLAADASNCDAVAAIYRAKGRPSFNPLIVHVANSQAAQTLAYWDERAAKLAQAFWPGPLTMVLPLHRQGTKRIAPAVTAGLDTVALRVPGHRLMRTVLERSGLALAAPSANRSGGISPTMADHVAQSLAGQVPYVLDGGTAERGLESTIIALRSNAEGVEGGWQLLRHGPISQEALTDILGSEPDAICSTKIEAPGQLAAHYAPRTPLHVNVETHRDDAWHIGFDKMHGDDNLSEQGDLFEAAANLYAALHRADAAGRASITVAPVPQEGIGVAINDRLQRAASGSGAV